MQSSAVQFIETRGVETRVVETRALRLSGAEVFVGSLLLAGAVLLLSGCVSPSGPSATAGRDSGPKRIPAGVLTQADPVPRDEPLSASGNSLSYVVFGKRYYRLKTARGFKEQGIASWYGKKFHGRLTASGEPYDMYSMTAAHKSLPLPTFARVTNMANKRSVIVRVNDRGPFVGNRLIDLSYAAAAKLDMLSAGTARVTVETLSGVPGEAAPPRAFAQLPVRPQTQSAQQKKPLPYKVPQPILSGPTYTEPLGTTLSKRLEGLSAGHYLQLGAFGSFDAAGEMISRINASHPVELFVAKQSDSELYRVQAGPFESVERLSIIQKQLQSQFSISAIPVARPALASPVQDEASTNCC